MNITELILALEAEVEKRFNANPVTTKYSILADMYNHECFPITFSKEIAYDHLSTHYVYNPEKPFAAFA